MGLHSLARRVYRAARKNPQRSLCVSLSFAFNLLLANFGATQRGLGSSYCVIVIDLGSSYAITLCWRQLGGNGGGGDDDDATNGRPSHVALPGTSAEWLAVVFESPRVLEVPGVGH